MKILSFDVGEKNFAYSIILKTDDNELIIEKIAHHNILKKKMQTIIESCIIITEILENIIKTLENDVFSIIIEQQMKTNIRAQKLAQHLWSYFYLKFGMKDPAFCLKFIPSHLKTQYFLGKNKLDNRSRKKWAVTKVYDILKKHNTEQNKFILSQLDALKKQDDICDTILQSIAFLKI